MNNDPRAQVAAYLEANEITITPDGRLIHASGNTSRGLADILFLDQLRDVANHNVKERMKHPSQRDIIPPNSEMAV